MYQIIYTDPPWQYGRSQYNGNHGTNSYGKSSQGAATYYPTMTIQDLKKMKPMIKKWSDPKGCLMFMWTSSPHLPVAIDLMKHWGFHYATIAFVWEKVRVNPGMYTMSSCEVCLVGKYKRIPLPRGARNVRQFLQKMRTKHSEKPPEIRDRIDKMFPKQKKIEMFARKTFDGWDAWGNEIGKEIVKGLPNSFSPQPYQLPLWTK